jgi:hypothetical protein
MLVTLMNKLNTQTCQNFSHKTLYYCILYTKKPFLSISAFTPLVIGISLQKV